MVVRMEVDAAEQAEEMGAAVRMVDKRFLQHKSSQQNNCQEQ